MKEITRVMIGESVLYRGYVIEVSENCAVIFDIYNEKEVAEARTIGSAIDLVDTLKHKEFIENIKKRIASNY